MRKNLDYFDVYNVIEKGLKISDLLALDYINEGMKNKTLSVEKINGEVYYLFSIVKMHEQIKEYEGVCSREAYTQRIKNLGKNGYLDVLQGNFYSQEMGYCRIALKLGKNFKKILNIGEV